MSSVSDAGSSRCDGVPPRKAAPIVFLRGANLIGEAEAVRPTLLLGAPPTIPHELVDVCLALGLELHGPNEIRATGAALERNVFDRQLMLGRQNMGEKSANLDVRCETFDPNVFGAAGRAVVTDRVLEGFSGFRLCE